MADRERLEKLRRLKALRQKAGTSTPAPQAPAPAPAPQPSGPAGMTYAGMPGRFQMDVQMGKTPTQAGGSLMLEAAKGFSDWASDEISAVTPQLAKDWLKSEIGSAVDALPKSFVKSVSEGIDSVQQWMNDNPEKGRTVEAAVAAGALLAPQANQMAKIGRLNKALDKSVTPYMNQANVSEMISDGRLKPGGATKFKFVDTPTVKAQKEALKTVKGFSPYQTNIKRREIVNQEIIDSSVRLQDRLDVMGKTPKGSVTKKQMNFAFSPKHVKNRFNKGLERSQFMTQKEYDTLVRDMKFRLNTNRADSSFSVGDIHKERKLIDHSYRNATSDRRLDGKLQPTRDEMIWRAKRDILNDIVDRVAPGSKPERARMKNLYDVREILHQKATKGELFYYKDASNRVPFMGDNPVKILPRGGR